MAKKALFTRPSHDIVTNYLYSWNKELIALAKEHHFQVKDLAGKQAIREEFEKYIKGQKPEIILINGHGNDTLICGHADEVLVEDTTSHILDGAVVHALSCNSAAILGLSAVENGAVAYIGYSMPFTLLTNKNYECNPDRDPLARIFKDPAIEAPKNLLKGNSISSSFDKAKEKYLEAIKSFSSSTAPPESETIRFALFTNMMCLELHCNNDMSFCIR